MEGQNGFFYYAKINHDYNTQIKYSEKLRPKTSLHGFKSNAMLCVNNVLGRCHKKLGKTSVTRI